MIIILLLLLQWSTKMHANQIARPQVAFVKNAAGTDYVISAQMSCTRCGAQFDCLDRR